MYLVKAIGRENIFFPLLRIFEPEITPRAQLQVHGRKPPGTRTTQHILLKHFTKNKIEVKRSYKYKLIESLLLLPLQIKFKFTSGPMSLASLPLLFHQA